MIKFIKNNQSLGFGIVGIIIVIAAVAVLGGGYLYYFYYYFPYYGERPILPPEIASRIQHQPNTPVAPAIPDISTWKTYRNEKYGFEVRYPLGWKECNEMEPLGRPNDVNVPLLKLAPTDVGCSLLVESAEITGEPAIFNQYRTLSQLKDALEKAMISTDKQFKVISKAFGVSQREYGELGLFEVLGVKEINLNGIPALSVEEGSPAGFGENMEIYIFHENGLFSIQPSHTEEFALREEQKLIFSTFKFIK